MARYDRNDLKMSEDNYENLKMSVIYQACYDYFNALREIRNLENEKDAIITITREMVLKGTYTGKDSAEIVRKGKLRLAKIEAEECEKFFYGDRWHFFSDIPAEAFINRIKNMVDEGKTRFF